MTRHEAVELRLRIVALSAAAESIRRELAAEAQLHRQNAVELAADQAVVVVDALAALDAHLRMVA